MHTLQINVPLFAVVGLGILLRVGLVILILLLLLELPCCKTRDADEGEGDMERLIHCAYSVDSDLFVDEEVVDLLVT